MRHPLFAALEAYERTQARRMEILRREEEARRRPSWLSRKVGEIQCRAMCLLDSLQNWLT